MTFVFMSFMFSLTSAFISPTSFSIFDTLPARVTRFLSFLFESYSLDFNLYKLGDLLYKLPDLDLQNPGCDPFSPRGPKSILTR